MRIKPITPIKDLLAQLPEGAVTAGDGAYLRAVRDLITFLRAEDGPMAKLLPLETRHALALELTSAVAQIIQAHIPRNARGRPPASKEPKPDRSAELEAKAQRAAARLELQTYKRLALELREALEKCEKESIAAAAAEPVGSIPSVDARRARMSQAGAPVHAAFSALLNAPTSCDHLREQAEAMAEDSQALAASIERWCTSQSLAGGKAHGVHKGKALPAWLEACKRLSRDIAQELRITPV